MKKLLVLLLALVMCVVGLTACFTNTPPAEDEGGEIEYKLDKAVAYVRSLYLGEEVKEEGSDVGIITKYADFKRVSSVPIAGVMYEVVWTVSETDETKVKVIQGSGTTETVIDVDEKTQEDIEFTLTATVKAGDGTSETITFNVLIPKYEVITYEEYRAKADGESATIEGIVVALNSKSAGNKRNHIFLVDAQGKGGYYAYDMGDDPVKLGIEVGMTVAVSGEVDIYQGMYELKGATARIINPEKTTPAAIDVSAKFGAGDDILEYVGALVTVKGVEIGGQELGGTSEYLFFSLNGRESYIRTYVTDLPTSFVLERNADDELVCASKAVIDAAHAAKKDWTANVTGVLIAYNGAPYLMPVGEDCFEYLTYVEKTPEVKISRELEALELVTKLSADKVVDVIVAGVDYTEVVISWSSNSEYAVVNGNQISFTIPESATTVTITATGTIGDVSATKTFEVELAPNTFVLSEGVPYYFGFEGADGMQYLDGANAGGKEFRWNLTTDNLLAAYYFVEIAGEGEYYIYYVNDEGAKTYLNIVKNGTYTNLLAGPEGVSKWVWNAELDALAVDVDGTVYVPKNYNGYTNVEAKSADYENGATYVLSLISVGFNFGFEGADGMQYLDGTTVADRNFRWNLTTDASLAATFYVEAAEGGYYFYFMKDGAKTYINIVENGTYINLLAGDTGISVWVYNDTLNAFTVSLNDKIYVPKNYSGYTNVEAKTDDYLADQDTTYCLDLFPVGYAPAADDDNTGSEGGETPDQPGTGEGGETPDAPAASAPEAGKEYFYGFEGADGKQYLDGTTVADRNFRWNLTTDASAAAIFVLEDAGDGAFYVSFTKDGVKTYVNIVKNGTYTNLLAGDAPISKWVWNADLGALVVDVDGTVYVPKNYNGYTNVEAKTLDYENGATYVLSFLAGQESGGNTETPDQPGTGEGGETPDQPGTGEGEGTTPDTPVAQGMYLAAVVDGTVYYFTGTVASGKGVVTTNVSEAAVIYGEQGASEDGAYIYILVDGVKKYLAVTANKTAGLGLVDTPFELFLYEGDGYAVIYDKETGRGFALYQGKDLRTYAVSSPNNFTGANAAFGIMPVSENN
ncbi:MAG: OB-fold nucleic acid binding domain-containing protein [Clostridia bacterium]|nr:OB-fold nucleic acid binding domain-containing protein [Clostridia bacterium]